MSSPTNAYRTKVLKAVEQRNTHGNYIPYEPTNANAEPTRKAHQNAEQVYKNLQNPKRSWANWFRGIKPKEEPSKPPGAPQFTINPLYANGAHGAQSGSGRKSRKYQKSRKSWKSRKSFRKGRKNFY